MDATNVNKGAGSKRKSDASDNAMRSDKKNPRLTPGSSLSNDGGDDDEDDDGRKLEEKRAYNRRNAARARQRTKDHILELTARAERYAAKNEALQKSNDKLVADVKALTEENQRLRQLVNMPRPVNQGTAAAGSSSPSSASLPAGSAALPSLGANAAIGIHSGNTISSSLGGGGVSGASFMDQGGPYQGGFYGPMGTMYFQPADPAAATASVSGMNDGSAAAAARQRGLLLHLLQQQQGGPGDGRHGFPPGYNF